MLRVPAVVRAFLIGALCAAAPARGDTPVADDEVAVSSACQHMFEWIAAEPIRFQASSAILRGSSTVVLERLAEFTRDCPATVIRITGHTDAVGDPAYNQALSEQRAAAVADYLAARGVTRDRLDVRGAGDSEPVADNTSEFGRERNRRIELELLPAPAAGGGDQSPSSASSGADAANSSTSNTSVESGGIGPRPSDP